MYGLQKGSEMVDKQDSLEEIRGMNHADKERLLKMIEEEACDNEIRYWGCSQAVLDALQRHLKLKGGDTFKAATAFAGGVAGNREACGALIGCIMAIGLASGRARYETGKIGLEQADLVECSGRARKYCDRFREKLGGLRCSEVRAALGFDPAAGPVKLTPETFKEHEKCGYVTGIAARLAAEIILEPLELYTAQIQATLDMMAQFRKQMSTEGSNDTT
jgi:C_GCAxxG_C_C family probable redox protein